MTSDQQRISEIEDKSEISSDREYEEVALSEVIDPVLGKTPKRKNDEYWGGDIKWASAKDISQNNTRKIYDTSEYMTAAGKEASNAKTMPEDTLVVIARGATMGRSAQLGEPMTFNQTCYGLNADSSKLLDDFLYYVWQYRFNQIQSVSHGTVFDTITMDSFKDIDIPLPPLETQKKICDFLTSIDDKIETNNRINEILEEMAEALFKSWFVNFDRYNKFKSSNIGEIPEAFEVRTFGDVSENYDSDRDPVSKTKRNEIEGDIPYYGATKVLDFMDDYLFDGKFLLIAEDGSVKTDEGYPVIQFVNKKFWASNHVHVVQGKGKVSTEFLRWTMSFVKIKPYITGSVQPKLNQTNLNSIELAVPPEEDIEEFTDLVKPLHDRIWQNKKENDYLERLRDTLLPKLMSGEIRLNDLELDELEVDSEV